MWRVICRGWRLVNSAMLYFWWVNIHNKDISKERVKIKFNLIDRFKFWCFDLVRKDFIRMWIFDGDRVLMIHNEKVENIGSVSLLGRVYEINTSNAIKSKNHYNIFYEYDNSSAIKFHGSKVVYSNKDLGQLIDRKIISKLFDISQISDIIVMAITGGTLAGVLYLILSGAGMGL